MLDVYFISGLGADQRIFQHIQLQRCRQHALHWITPHRHESMQAYARRLSAQIHTTQPLLIGMSFGGMMAIEISRILQVKGVILISSVKTRAELPPYFQLLHVFPVHRWLPYSWLQALGIRWGKWLFGPQCPSTHHILNEVIRHTDETFFRWAWQRVISWKTSYLPERLIHIHGNRDHMLPLCFIKKVDHVIPGGTHLMVLDHAEEINPILQQLIDEYFDAAS
ncbi:MAG: alpha/beta hydrolase [Thermoflavifilum sp.]|nr:alpha/beta hydrolase [Thermoflavifilum sp.]